MPRGKRLPRPRRAAAGRAHLQGVRGLLAAAVALLQQVELELRGLAIEDVDGLDARLQHLGRAVEHAQQVAGDLSGLVAQQLVPHAAHGYEELVNVHAGVDRDLAAKVVLELLALDAAWRVIAEQLGEALDPHGCRAGTGGAGNKTSCSRGEERRGEGDDRAQRELEVMNV